MDILNPTDTETYRLFKILHLSSSTNNQVSRHDTDYSYTLLFIETFKVRGLISAPQHNHNNKEIRFDSVNILSLILEMVTLVDQML